MMKCYYTALILFILTVSGVIVQASEEFAINTEIDKSSLTTGDFLLYQIEVTHPIQIQIQPIALKQYIPEEIDVEALEPVLAFQQQSEESSWYSQLWPFEKKATPTQQMIRWSWRLWPSQKGMWIIPEIEIKSVQTQGGQNEPLYQGKTKAMTFTVNSLLDPDPQNPQQLPVLRINKEVPPSPDTMNWIWLIVAGSAVILLGIAYYFYQRKNPKIQVEPEEMPHERALRRLRELEHFLSANPQEVHQYYYLLSEIFREFLENQFQFAASSMTTQEFLPMLESATSYTAEERNKIVLLTQKSDLIKYAEALPTRAEIEEAYREVITLIENVAYTEDEGSEMGSSEAAVQEVS